MLPSTGCPLLLIMQRWLLPEIARTTCLLDARVAGAACISGKPVSFPSLWPWLLLQQLCMMCVFVRRRQ